VNLAFIVNPFFLYCIAFSIAIVVYLFGWSDIYPRLSAKLLLFLIISLVPFCLIGLYFWQKGFLNYREEDKHIPIDLLFYIFLFLGILLIFLIGYIPLFKQGFKYREYGVSVLDPIYYSLSVFISVYYFHSYLKNGKLKFLIYLLVIVIFQILLYRRYTLVWIFLSCIFLFIFIKQKLPVFLILTGLVFIIISSFLFGYFGNKRSNFDKDYILGEFSANSRFTDLNISYNHFLTYLYISSPLANLQKNTDIIKSSFSNNDVKTFAFYCIVPSSLTARIEDYLNLSPPECSLISPNLIVGSYYMNGYHTLGWYGMIILTVFLLVCLSVSILIVPRSSPAFPISICLASTTAVLMIFDNFLIRLDVILMLFIYPLVLHFIYLKLKKDLSPNPSPEVGGA
jgi:hypothetical protein